MRNGGTRPELKIAVLGAGNVGAAAAAIIAGRDLGRTWLYDVAADLAAGKAMDINHASPFFHHDARVAGTDNPADLAGADIVVITAGAPRRAGMSRADLLGLNAAVCEAIDEQVLSLCPEAKVLIVTNPVDALTAYLADRRPEMCIFGLGCTLDTVRFRFLLAEAAHDGVDAADAMVIGTHNDHMIPLVDRATIGGTPIRRLLTEEQIRAVVEQTRTAGHVIVSKLKDRGSFYAAAHCVAAIVASIVADRGEVFPVSAPCRGEFGFHDVALALPRPVGADGPGEAVAGDLSDAEAAALARCAEDVRGALGELAHACR